MPRGIFSEEQKVYEKFHASTKTAVKVRQDYKFWRTKWKKNGIIKFAFEVLEIDPITGGPLLLSADQELFLHDVTHNVDLAIISAGRGSGKTFALAVYVIWRIFTHDYYHISCIGGSQPQSDKIQDIIRGWIRHNKAIKNYTWKNVKGLIKSHSESSVVFLTVSPTSTRGPHVQDVIIDEEAAGEEAGGTKYIKAALWQGSTSTRLHIIKSSTPHFVHGDFLDTWNNAERKGYKRYHWAVAKHISGEKDPFKTYTDIVSQHWLSNVPWGSDDAIQKLRKGQSNEEWLVEALGTISVSSGLVFNPADIGACICDRCLDQGEPCRPYEGSCPIIQFFMQLEGVPNDKIPRLTKDALQRVKQRIMGIDWGQIAPDAYCVTGKFKNMVFVLEQLELKGQSDEEKIERAVGKWKMMMRGEGKNERPTEVLIEKGLAQKWHTEIIRPDPQQWAYNNQLRSRGFAIHELFAFEGGQEKKTYIYTLKKLIERHLLLIPCAFEDLVRSLKQLTYDKKGRVRKSDDHSFDSLLYAISYYGEVMDAPLFKLSKKERKGVQLWRKDVKPPVQKRRDVFKDKKEKKKDDKDEDASPFRGGVKIW